MKNQYAIKSFVLAVVLCVTGLSHASGNLDQLRSLLEQSIVDKSTKKSAAPVRHKSTAQFTVTAEPVNNTNYVVENATENPFEGESFPLDGVLELDNSGSLDGIYLCNVVVEGETVNRESYISVNGKSTGETVFIIGDVVSGKNPFFGYGTGYVFSDASGVIYAFQGKTSAKHDFSLTAKYDADGIVYAEGKVTINFKSMTSSQTSVSALAYFSCVSLW